MRRRWAIIEDVPQMSVALGAEHLDAFHEETRVRLRPNILLRNRRPETGPACSGLELLLRAKQGVSAADAPVYPYFVVVPIAVGKRKFRPLLSRDRKLLGRQNLPPLSLSLQDFLHTNYPLACAAVGEHGQGYLGTGPFFGRIGHVSFFAG